MNLKLSCIDTTETNKQKNFCKYLYIIKANVTVHNAYVIFRIASYRNFAFVTFAVANLKTSKRTTF